MNILVCVKRVPLTGGKIVLTDDERAISTRHLGFTVSPHEECGAEEAVRLIEQHGGASTVLTLGPPEAEEQLRDMMAIGVDRGVHLVTDGEEWDPQATAAAIVDAIRQQPEPHDLILFGNESADAGNYQVAIRVAHALGLPVVTGVKAIAVEDGTPALRAGGRRRARRLRRADAGGRHRQGGHQPAALPVGARPAAGQAQAARHDSPTPREPRLEMVTLTLPPGSGKQAEVLGDGPTRRPRSSTCCTELGVL